MSTLLKKSLAREVKNFDQTLVPRAQLRLSDDSRRDTHVNAKRGETIGGKGRGDSLQFCPSLLRLAVALRLCFDEASYLRFCCIVKFCSFTFMSRCIPSLNAILSASQALLVRGSSTATLWARLSEAHAVSLEKPIKSLGIINSTVLRYLCTQQFNLSFYRKLAYYRFKHLIILIALAYIHAISSTFRSCK